MGRAYRVKTQTELNNLQVAAAFLKYSYSELEEMILDVIEQDKPMKMAKLTTKIEAIFDDEKKIEAFASKHKASSAHLEFPLPALL